MRYCIPVAIFMIVSVFSRSFFVFAGTSFIKYEYKLQTQLHASPYCRISCHRASFALTLATFNNTFSKNHNNLYDFDSSSPYLLAGNDNVRYEKIYAFAHYKRNSDSPTDFYRLHTFPYNRMRKPLEITGQHMVYLHGKQNPIRADSLKVGDVLRGDHYTGLTVTKIQRVKRYDNYAPLTPHGTILVDGIVASSYISLQKNAREHIELGESGFEVRISQRVMVHMFLSPFRNYCLGFSSDLCRTYNDDGLPPYVAFGLKLADWGIAQDVLVQLVALVVFFLVLVPCVLIEDLAGPEWGPVMLLITAVCLVLYKRSNYRVRIKIRHPR